MAGQCPAWPRGSGASPRGSRVFAPHTQTSTLSAAAGPPSLLCPLSGFARGSVPSFKSQFHATSSEKPVCTIADYIILCMSRLAYLYFVISLFRWTVRSVRAEIRSVVFPLHLLTSSSVWPTVTLTEETNKLPSNVNSTPRRVLRDFLLYSTFECSFLLQIQSIVLNVYLILRHHLCSLSYKHTCQDEVPFS